MGADLSLFGPPRPSRARRVTLLVIERLLFVVALASLGYVAGTVGGAMLYQDYESRQLDEELRGAQPPEAARSAVVVERRVLGRLEIPRLGVSTLVREGEDARTLQLAVGHIAGTALPGTAGNMGLAGHRDTFFRRLREINPGDLIRLVAVEGTFTYAVERTQIVDPDDLWVLDPTPEPSLTLVTCYPFTYIGTAPERFIVRAKLVGPGTSKDTPLHVDVASATVVAAAFSKPDKRLAPAAGGKKPVVKGKKPAAKNKPPAARGKRIVLRVDKL
jgi:sortase A